jgi:hypothetical protein
LKSLAHPRSARFNSPTTSVVSRNVMEAAISAWTFSTMRRMLLRDGQRNARLPRLHRVPSSKRKPQEVELPFRDPTDSCLLLVDRQLQLAHELAQRRKTSSARFRQHSTTRSSA